MTRNLFVFAGIATLVFGLPLIFSPDYPAKIFLTDSTLTGGAAGTFRGYGILLSSVAIGLLAARNSGPSTARRALLLIVVIATIAGVVNSVCMIMQGTSTSKGWIIVALCAVEAIWGILALANKEKLAGG